MTATAVSKTRGQIVEALESYYGAYYDVSKAEAVDGGAPHLELRCDLHVSNQKYFLFRKNVLWEANCHEYVYIFSVPRLTEEVFLQCEEYTHAEGMKLVRPEPGHMYTYLTCVIIADETEPGAVRLLKKSRIHKSFRFSLRGWMDLHAVALDRSTGRTFTNRSGRENAKLFHKII